MARTRTTSNRSSDVLRELSTQPPVSSVFELEGISSSNIQISTVAFPCTSSFEETVAESASALVEPCLMALDLQDQCVKLLRTLRRVFSMPDRVVNLPKVIPDTSGFTDRTS